MQNPRNLRVAVAAEDLAEAVYTFTRAFPSAERFGLTAQMRRAAVSIGSNIFEGCGRQSNKSLVAFLYIAQGSASELEFQLGLARRLGMGAEIAGADVESKLDHVRRMLSRLIRHLERTPIT